MSNYQVGEVLAGKYEIKAVLGTGGMGSVYRARQLDLNRDVAIKVPLAQALEIPGFLARFSREARTVAKLMHDNIVQVYEFQQTDEGTYIVMEFVEGQDLKHLIQNPPPDLRIKDMAIILRNSCEGLAHAHEFGIVHRDIKPHNIMIQKRGRGKWRVKIMDFGIAHLEAGSNVTMQQEQLTVTGQAIGTPTYMSPEQIRGTQVTARSDIYSFGCVAFFCFTRKTPFSGTGFTVAAAHLSNPPPRIRAMVPQLPEGLEQIVNRCLAKDPDERPQDASDLGQEIYEALKPVFDISMADVWPAPDVGDDGTDLIKPTKQLDSGERAAPTVRGETLTVPAAKTEPGTVTDRPAPVDIGETARMDAPPEPAGAPIPGVQAHAASPHDPTIGVGAEPSPAGPAPRRAQPALAKPAIIAAAILLPLLVIGVALGIALTGGGDNGAPPGNQVAAGDITPRLQEPVEGIPGGPETDITDEQEEQREPEEQPGVAIGPEPEDPTEPIVTPRPTPDRTVVPPETPTARPTDPPTPTPDPLDLRLSHYEGRLADARGIVEKVQLWRETFYDPQFGDAPAMRELARQAAQSAAFNPEMAAVTARSYIVGSRDTEGQPDEHPQRSISLSAYEIGKYPVTALEFATFLNSIGQARARELYIQRPEHNVVLNEESGEFIPRRGEELAAVNGLSWDAADAYTRWLSEKTGQRFRLPTEAEWEAAARADGGNVIYPWGTTPPDSSRAHFNQVGGRPIDVTSRSAGANSWGLYHMAGNVAEWCLDWYSDDAYRRTPQDNPVVTEAPSGQTRPRRVLRGGSFMSTNADQLRVAARHRAEPDRPASIAGMRLVREVR